MKQEGPRQLCLEGVEPRRAFESAKDAAARIEEGHKLVDEFDYVHRRLAHNAALELIPLATTVKGNSTVSPLELRLLDSAAGITDFLKF